MAEVKKKVDQITSGDFVLYHLDEDVYELSTGCGSSGYLKVVNQDADALIDILTAFKKEMEK